jgi:hypothetical protein
MCWSVCLHSSTVENSNIFRVPWAFTHVSNSNWFSFHTMYYSGQYSHTQCGPTSTHGSLSLKSYIIVLYFKNATYMIKWTAQLFNQILCIWIVPPQCTFYSFSNYVNVIQTGMWKQVSGCSTRPAFNYTPSPLHCTKCAELLAQHVASGSNLESVMHMTYWNWPTHQQLRSCSWQLCSSSWRNSHFIINTNYIFTYPNTGSSIYQNVIHKPGQTE